jgi:hypothetical protein
MFQLNDIKVGNITALLELWTTKGLLRKPGLSCRCPVSLENSPKKESKKKKKAKKKKNSVGDNSKVKMMENIDSELQHAMNERAVLDFPEDGPPLHLYFFASDVKVTPDGCLQDTFAPQMEWPFQLTIKGVTYTLFSRGY